MKEEPHVTKSSVTFDVFGATYPENVNLTGLTNGAYWVSFVAHRTGGVPENVMLNAGSAYAVRMTGMPIRLVSDQLDTNLDCLYHHL